MIDPQRAKIIFDSQTTTTEVSQASQDWFMEEIKRNSKLSEEEIKEALKQDANAVEDPNFTVIEKV